MNTGSMTTNPSSPGLDPCGGSQLQDEVKGASQQGDTKILLSKRKVSWITVRKLVYLILNMLMVSELLATCVQLAFSVLG